VSFTVSESKAAYSYLVLLAEWGSILVEEHVQGQTGSKKQDKGYFVQYSHRRALYLEARFN